MNVTPASDFEMYRMVYKRFFFFNYTTYYNKIHDELQKLRSAWSTIFKHKVGVIFKMKVLLMII